MIQILLLLKNNWKLVLTLFSIGASFCSGWHIKGKLDMELIQEELLQARQEEQNRAAAFESTQANVLQNTHNLIENMHDENAKNPNHCLISTASLHALQQANK